MAKAKPKDQIYDQENAAEVLGRTHITGYAGWPPPKNISQHLEVFADFVDSLLDDGTVLDLGCGDGSLDRILASKNRKRKITATDLEPHPQWKLPHPKNLEFKAVSIYKLSYEPGSFDYIVLKDVLHHLPEPQKSLAHIAKIAKKGVVVIEANRYNPISYVRMVKIAKHEHFSRRKLKRVIAKPADIYTFETHVWPASLEAPGKLVDWFFRLPILSRLRNYNVASFKP